MPAIYPPEAYADSLQGSQSAIAAQRDEAARKAGREKVDFVPAAPGAAVGAGAGGPAGPALGGATSNTTSRVSTPGSTASSRAVGRGGGVGREKGRVATVRDGRGRWDDERRAGKRSRTGSRSPRR